MQDNRKHQNQETHSNQSSQQNMKSSGAEKQTSDKQRPENRLKDGTNDLQSGDENPASREDNGRTSNR